MRKLGIIALLVAVGICAIADAINLTPGSSITVEDGTALDSAKGDTSAWLVPLTNRITNTVMDAMLAFRHTAKGTPNPLCTLKVQYSWGVDSLYKMVDIKLLADSTETFHFFLMNLDSLRPDKFRFINKGWRDSMKIYEALEYK